MKVSRSNEKGALMKTAVAIASGFTQAVMMREIDCGVNSIDNKSFIVHTIT